jgi:hypothetical protein
VAAVAEGVRAHRKPPIARVALDGLGRTALIAHTLATGISSPLSSTRPSLVRRVI